jgi:bisphosphoglycerate-independent phosphoglycerate mutase (AlkP superfamily)
VKLSSPPRRNGKKIMSEPRKHPTVLIILDGWGYREETRDNAIANGSFDTNAAYTGGIDKAIAAGGAVHLFGLLSPGGVHSHEQQIFAAIRLAASRGAQKVYLHAFLDGRETPPRSAGPSLAKASALFQELGCGRVASITGRYYAMDRDNRWDRVKQAWDLLTAGEAPHRATDAAGALDQCLGRVEQALLQSGGQALVTADHGNCEQMVDYDSGQNHTQHTTEHVPLVYIGQRPLQLNPTGGKLADIAPTLLALMDLPQPQEMAGANLAEALTEKYS